ncbi:MAG: dephospho-CoA kinase [Chloroflexi bacterium RBG_16_57_11]|nr:MAG: dephospho-CoA kinase [Chloroflexi bacterium RBG_16_57_11]
MSAWSGKFVIGLTGNIGTGKSVVRKMLEHLGAYGIDADALANRAIAKGSPGYQPVADLFGRWILDSDDQIDRAKLGRLVFSNPDALESLEKVIHPLVGQALDILIRRSRQEVVVIEAIKLIEAGLAKKCDSLWVTYAQQEQQIARLIQKRGMTEANAIQRIHAQPPQEDKVIAADVVIRNDHSFEETWTQVVAAWNNLFPGTEVEPIEETEPGSGEIVVHRARPREAEAIAGLITKLSGGVRKVTRQDIMAAFGEKAFLLLKVNGRPLGLAGWKVENLVACTDEVFIDKSLGFFEALGAMLSEVERASRELQCEISLLFLPIDYVNQETSLHALGYKRRTIQSLGVRAWEEAAQESMPARSIMLFKQLRRDRVLRPV